MIAGADRFLVTFTLLIMAHITQLWLAASLVLNSARFGAMSATAAHEGEQFSAGEPGDPKHPARVVKVIMHSRRVMLAQGFRDSILAALIGPPEGAMSALGH